MILPAIEPYYKGFKGTIEKIMPQKYLIKGCYTRIDDTKIHVTELPVGFATDDFKQHLEKLMDNTGKKTKSVIRDYNDMSTDTVVDMTIIFANGVLDIYEANLISETKNNCNHLEKVLKLYTTQTTTNMHMFDANEKLKKYDNVIDIVKEFFVKRLELYDIRKKYQLKSLEKDLLILSNKVKYILGNLSGDIDLRRKTSDMINGMLEAKKFDKLDGEYKYLIKMPMDSVSKEKSDQLMNERKIKEKEVRNLKKLSIQNIWINELSELKIEYAKFLASDPKKKKKIKKN